MAITNSQQFKQLLAQGGRTHYQTGAFGGNPHEATIGSPGASQTPGSSGDNNKGNEPKRTIPQKIKDFVTTNTLFGKVFNKLNSLGTGWRSHMGPRQDMGYNPTGLNPFADQERGRGGDYPISILPKTPYQQDIIEEEDSSDGILNSDRAAYRLLADGGRVPAAFGGIMDSATGRRAYGFGSIFKKATKLPRKVAKTLKKVAKSDLGKLALMYAAGTYLGGTTMFGGTGQLSFAQRLRDPRLLANLINPTGGGLGEGKGWSMFQKATPAVNASSYFPTRIDPQLSKAITGTDALAGQSTNILGGAAKEAGKGSLWKTAATIGIPSVIAGAMTAEQPVQDWDEDKTAYGEDIDIAAIRANPRKYLAPRFAAEGGLMRTRYAGGMDEKLIEIKKIYDDYVKGGGTLSFEQFAAAYAEENFAEGGRVAAQEGGLMDLGGMEKDYREEGGFVPIGGEEKADDVPARLSKNEFVFTADAVRAAGGGDIDAGSEVMYNVMKNLEAGGDVSEESQGLDGAREMFQTSQRLEEVI